MRWNDETQICTTIVAAYIAVLVYAIRRKSARPVLWMIRTTLLVFVLFHSFELVKDWQNGSASGVENALIFLQVVGPLFLLSLLRLPTWLIWVVFGIFGALALFCLWFIAFFHYTFDVVPTND